MSRQKKQNSPEQPGRHNNQPDRQTYNEQLFALQGQIDHCQQQQRQLIQSRNYAILAAIVAGLAIFYLLFLKVPEDNAGQQQALIARQLAAQKKQLTNEQCIPVAIQQAILDDKQSIIEDAEQTIARIEKKLGGAITSRNSSAEDTDVRRISSILNKHSPGEIASPGSQRQYKQAISRMIHLWAVAWELQDLPAYFAYYSSNFDPQSSASNRQEWRALRSHLIGKPVSIKVTVRDIEIKHLDDNTATVSFNQRYQTPDYADKTHKLMELVREDEQWRILRESSATTQIDFQGKR